MKDHPIIRFEEALSDSREFRLVTPKIETSLSGRVRQQRYILHNFRVILGLKNRYSSHYFRCKNATHLARNMTPVALTSATHPY